MLETLRFKKVGSFEINQKESKKYTLIEWENQWKEFIKKIQEV